MLAEMAFLLALVSLLLVFVKTWVGREDIGLKIRLEDLYLRQEKEGGSLVRLNSFRRLNRSNQIQDVQNNDVLLLFYTKLPVLRISQWAATAFVAITLFSGICLIVNEKIRNMKLSQLFQKGEGTTFIGLDIGLFFGGLIFLFSVSVWLFFFRGRIMANSKGLGRLSP